MTLPSTSPTSCASLINSHLTKIFTLRARLSPKLKDALLHRDEPTGLTEFIEMVNKVGIKIRAYRAENQGSHGSRAAPTSPPRPVTQGPPPPPAHASHAPGGLALIDLSYGAPGRRHISPQDSEARQREEHCFYCGGAGHMSSFCPAKKPKTGARQGWRASGLVGVESRRSWRIRQKTRTPWLNWPISGTPTHDFS